MLGRMRGVGRKAAAQARTGRATASRVTGAMRRHPGRTAAGIAGGMGVAAAVSSSGRGTDRTRRPGGMYRY